MQNFAFLSAKTQQWLAELGILTRDDLQKFGADHVFLALQQRHSGLTRKLFWALLAAQHGEILSAGAQQQAWDNLPDWRFRKLLPTEIKQAQIWMHEALLEAQKAEKIGEIPVGAIVIFNNEIIARAHNQNILRQDPSAHAEILALKMAAETLQNHRLNQAQIVVTLEPCAMCAGAILHARMARVIFGAADPKTGAAGGLLNLFASRMNAQTSVHGNILAQPCSDILQNFFQKKRKNTNKISQNTAKSS